MLCCLWPSRGAYNIGNGWWWCSEEGQRQSYICVKEQQGLSLVNDVCLSHLRVPAGNSDGPTAGTSLLPSHFAKPSPRSLPPIRDLPRSEEFRPTPPHPGHYEFSLRLRLNVIDSPVSNPTNPTVSTLLLATRPHNTPLTPCARHRQDEVPRSFPPPRLGRQLFSFR